MTNTKTIKQRACAIFLVALILLELLLGFFGIRASAETVSYTDVLEDLQRDRNFDVSLYPENPESSEIKVIHIAEGDEGELYIYTYQPGNVTKHRKANYINMSLDNPATKGYQNVQNALYSLTWLNSNGVFDKYLVNKFTVKDAVERYYNIAGIYRPYDSDVDSSSSSELIDTVQCKSFSVGQYWRCYYYNDVLMYESNRIDVVQYEVFDTGTIRYLNGFDPKAPYQSSFSDSHYAVINITNYDVDRIIDADISYKLVQYEHEVLNNGQDDGPKKINTIEKSSEFISDLETGSNTPSGWFAKEYTWQRILPAEDFKKISEDNANEKFSDDEVKALKGPDLNNPYKNMFVFAFAETTWSRDHYNDEYGGFCDTYWTTENFGLLRLHFVSGNKTYNLGAVGDLVGTDSNPEMVVDGIDNIKNTLEDAQEWLEFIVRIVGIILLIVLLSFIARPVGFVFKIIWTGVTFVLKVVFNIITLPFRLIFGRRRY